jgi:hypothetical protein
MAIHAHRPLGHVFVLAITIANVDAASQALRRRL